MSSKEQIIEVESCQEFFIFSPKKINKDKFKFHYLIFDLLCFSVKLKEK